MISLSEFVINFIWVLKNCDALLDMISILLVRLWLYRIHNIIHI